MNDGDYSKKSVITNYKGEVMQQPKKMSSEPYHPFAKAERVILPKREEFVRTDAVLEANRVAMERVRAMMGLKKTEATGDNL